MLADPRAVMVNRGGASLENGRSAANFVGLPLVGEDAEDLVLCDAGNALVGFGFKQRQANVEADQCCSLMFLNDVNVSVANPGSELEFVPTSFEDAVARIASTLQIARPHVEGSILPTREGLRLSFFDVDGNLTTFNQPTEPARPGRANLKLRTLVERRGIEIGRPGRRGGPPALVGITLLVTNLRTSLDFYRNVLGLQPLRLTPREGRFDAGSLILTVKTEPQLGMVKSLRAQQLLRDQLIFYVPDLEAEVEALMAQGVAFPLGIEGSISAGRVALFADPDGHNLWLWQPPDQFGPDMRIDFYPVLERILQEQE